MAADPEPDPWEDPPARIPAPDDRLWRHPSELGGFTPAPVAAPARAHRTSNLTALAGACLAGLLVSAGVLWLARPMPDEQRRPRIGSGVTASIVGAVASTTVPVPLAAAAAPLRRAQSTPTGLAVGVVTPGRLHVEVADADTDADGTPDGALVVTVRSDGPAAGAGVIPGDVITAVGDLPVDHGAALSDALAPTRPGQQVVLRVRRDDTVEHLTVALTP
ncbi:MAG TPA: PDZ domain-containing protein [Acidimicrobiales bacterium]|nr:PDZ domain-containing protein [Acidimicrobiales bacterium]